MNKELSLTLGERAEYCRRLTEMLPALRARMGKTQAELGEVSGVSRVTLSQIESHRAQMNWLHFSALMMVCFENREAKEMLFANGLLDERLLRFYQFTNVERPTVNVEIKADKVALLCCLGQTDQAAS